MLVSVREELQELINARESGAAYFLGQSHLSLRDDSTFIKKYLIMTYVFLDKNCREPPVALNIPHAALVEVGSIDEADQSHNIMKQKLAAGAMPSSSLLTQTDLDHFMEAYCLALTKLKEAMEEPQHETAAFINSMHMQLRELTTTYPETSDHSTTSSDIRRKHD
ncbi:hypothetical protein GH714_000778 [Hevea brasiliensis]|uniref:KNOX2 domain-containing protein n=1 Tax=Hevea brasiliensis TaxID=3981 RepID=A0A6A6MA79_HEVBR|nr:hypothetical protein GH714_000778 [Hevea brasiliensis]